MKTLESLIKEIDGWYLKSPQDILDILNVKNIEYIDNTPWTWAGVAAVVGNVGAESLRIALENNGMGWAVHQLGGSGLDLSLPDVQNALYYLESLGVSGMENVALSVKRMISVLEKNQINTDIEEISKTYLLIKLEKLRRDVLNRNAIKWNQFCQAVQSWDGTGPEPEL